MELAPFLSQHDFTRMVAADEPDGPNCENFVFAQMSRREIGFESLAGYIRNALPLMKGRISDTGIIIPRVPERLRLGENDAYEPRIISLGPYHHGERKLRAKERYKVSYLQEILSRDPMIELENYINLVGSMVDKIRSCYPDYFELGPLKFLVVMVIDGCFVVEHLLRVHERVKDELNSMVLIQLLKYDILLLENQLPFFILDGIYKLAITTSSSNSYPPSFTHLAIGYFNWVFQKEINLPPPETVHHLLHLYHLFCLYTPGVEEGAGDQTIISNIDITSLTGHKDSSIMIPGVTVLQEAGIRFKVKEVEGSSLDVTFIEGEGEMVIPRLLIDSSTKSKLRNLIAFEQLYPNYEGKFYKTFSVYCSFMNDIINTPEDVALLCEKDIIRHSLGSNDEVAHIFNHLSGGAIIAPSHYLNDIYKKVGDYRKARWHRWRANLLHNYLNSPWAVLGIVAGGILLVLTFLQTYFSGDSAY